MLLALLLLPMMNRLSRQHQRCTDERREEEAVQAQAMASAQ
jgi:POT family proton-dependent oligopeptide transporter